MSRRSRLIILLVAAVFFVIKSVNLTNYNFYSGKVVGFETIIGRYPSKYGADYIERDAPIITYHIGGDSVTYTDGHRVIVSHFYKNERVTIIEDQRNSNKVTVFSFFYYWLKPHEIIIVGLIIFVIYGYCRVYIKKNPER